MSIHPSWRRRRASLYGAVLGAAVLWVGQVNSDSLLPYGTRLFVAEGGREYVLVRPTPTGEVLSPDRPRDPRAEYVWAVRPEGQDPLVPGDQVLAVGEGTAFEPYPGDKLIRRGSMEDLPLRVLPAGDRGFFAAIDAWAFSGRSTAVAIVRRDGEPVALALRDIFAASEVEQFMVTGGGSISWLRAAWLGEKQVVLASTRGHIRAVGTDGSVRSLPVEEFSQLVPHFPAAERAAALDVLGALKYKPPNRILERLFALDQPMAVRLRAAVPLAIEGSDPAKRVLIERALERWSNHAVRDEAEYSLAALPHFLNWAQLSPVYDHVIGQQGQAAVGAVSAGLAVVLRKSPDVLLALLRDKSQRIEMRLSAIFAVRKEEYAPAAPVLLAVAREEGDHLAIPALGTVAGMGGGLERDILGLFGRSEGLDATAAAHFTEARFVEAVPILIERLERAPRDGESRVFLVDALEFQTSRRFGDNPAAWRRWFQLSQR